MGTRSILSKGPLFFYASITNTKTNYVSDNLLQNTIPAKLPKKFTTF